VSDATKPAWRKVAETILALRWGDQDAFSHVNNAMYLRYIEEARVRWLANIAGIGTAAPPASRSWPPCTRTTVAR
jgi:acyl-CoA thioesterase FadM